MRHTWIGAAVVGAIAGATPVGAQTPWQSSETQAPAARTTLEQKTSDGARFGVPGGVLRVTVWGERAIRVTVGAAEAAELDIGLAVLGTPARVPWTITEDADRFIIATPSMRVTVAKTDGRVALLGADGKPLIGESDPVTRRLGDAPEPDGRIQQRFEIGGAQAIYGLGQHQTGLLNYRGTTVRLQQANTDVGVPVFVSSAGYGLFWNNPAVTDVAIAVPQATDRIVFRSQAGKGIDYFLFGGPDVDDVIGAYRGLTGQAPLMARWTWGLWQSKERYGSQAELLGVAARYRAMKIPLDAVVQDWQYWKPGEWGSHRMDPARYPDPKGMLDTLHRQNVHSIVSIWPRFDSGLDTTKALDAVGGLYAKTYPNVYPAGEGRWYDAFSKTARATYWRFVSERLGKAGFDGYWLDGSEAELGGHWGEMRDVRTAIGSGAEVYNAYPLMHTSAVHDGMATDFAAKRPIILTRSAWAGQQRNAAITWSGDVAGRWDVFRAQIPAGVNFSMTGIPYWSADIGGFFGGSPDDPAYQELFTRWLQFAVFNPMFRIHGTGAGKEVYSFPEAARGPLLDAVALRYRLLPFLYAQSWKVTQHGASFLYPAGMAFPHDEAARDLRDEYLFGRSILVSPVVEKGATSRQVYLPAGTDWYDFWSGARLTGGTRVTVAAPIGQIPLHIAAGTILPLGQRVQYTEQSPALPTELRVYRGRDGRFTLYDDAGDGQGWRRGERATIDLALDDKTGVLTIGARQGRYPGMPASRIFHVVSVGASNGVGLGEGIGRTIAYTGKAVSVALDADGSGAARRR
ncbi:TIM-barrel domain-containing protein [Sphingomonas sp. PP-CE-1G-424]|uniref:glycoside hydrolase family 31 protein n=1 Tax=Sphingomonas sp. PP-CE-1G-424 TaxID=2135658 RepID=UPI0010552161|nr:TIM-barrel domain-containing protein [Sphingomonas sp. PP-CE-1G-424]TCP66981.1 alpha-D-xyloside xylohydrolase [Sphingomonas sp. PP-CE-1G-424]